MKDKIYDLLQSVRHDMDGATTEQYDCERLIDDIEQQN